MIDGVYQSVMCFYVPYLLFRPGSFVTKTGQQIDDILQIGVYVACAEIVVINLYMLLNTYRWDWLMLLIVAISILLIWWWTGVFSLSHSSPQFYHSAAHVFGQLSFWVTVLLTVILCLLPRFTAKAFQKIFLPRDVDIIREQVRQGHFSHLDDTGAHTPPLKVPSASSSEVSRPMQPTSDPEISEDRRPIYPPSMTATATTYNPRSQEGSDGTDYIGPRESLERPLRLSLDRPRPSYDRMRSSMDRIRPSFEASNEFTSAAMLTRVESSQCTNQGRRDNGIIPRFS